MFGLSVGKTYSFAIFGVALAVANCKCVWLCALALFRHIFQRTAVLYMRMRDMLMRKRILLKRTQELLMRKLKYKLRTQDLLMRTPLFKMRIEYLYLRML